MSGTVVYYNSDVDVAVIDVPELDGPTIGFDLKGKARQQGAALGFPQDGPFDAQPVRIRGDQRLRSPDIYGDGTVTRHVFSLRGLIRPGNSGGPVVSTGGQGARGRLRRLGERPEDGIRAHRRAGPPSRSHRARRRGPGLQRQLRLRVGPVAQLRLSRVLFSLACSIARSGALTFLIIRTPMNPSRPASSR